MSFHREPHPPAVPVAVFDHIFTQCVAQGFVVGATLAVDLAPVKANAVLEAVREKQVTGTCCLFLAPAASVAPAPAHQMRNLAARQARLAAHSSVLDSRRSQAQQLSNKTHYSPTDPDVRISVKPGKVRALNYCCSRTVNTAQGVISHVQADFADSRGSRHLPYLLTGLQQRLWAHDLPLRELLADVGCANGWIRTARSVPVSPPAAGPEVLARPLLATVV